jgi:hypothetical protein
LGFDKVRGRLVADPRIQAHVITIDVTSPAGADGQAFKVSTVRFNPAAAGAVTGNATYVRPPRPPTIAIETHAPRARSALTHRLAVQASFLSSLLLAYGRGDGVHFC